MDRGFSWDDGGGMPRPGNVSGSVKLSDVELPQAGKLSARIGSAARQRKISLRSIGALPSRRVRHIFYPLFRPALAAAGGPVFGGLGADSPIGRDL